MWRTAVDVLSDRAALSVIDKDSGYLRSEWKTSPIRDYGVPVEERYTLRLRPREGRVRFGIDQRLARSSTPPDVMINSPQAPWAQAYNELRQRLASFRE